MGRRPSLALLIIVAGAFFLFGLYSAFLQKPSAAPQVPTREPVTLLPTPVETQAETTILLLGVDDLQAAEPTLRAIWFLTYRPPADDIFLLGVALDRQVAGDPPIPLQEAFGWQGGAGPSQSFRDALYRTVPLQIEAIVVLDDAGFAAAVDYVGGVDINDANFTGHEVLGILSLNRDDPAANLMLQRRLLAALAARADSLGPAPELTPLIELMPDHLFLSRELNQMVALISPILPIEPQSTHFELY